MLKDSRDVEEAMVVGQDLPYRLALIWIKRGFDRIGALTAIVQAEPISTVYLISLKPGWLV